MPRGVILRLYGTPQGPFLAENGVVAIASRSRLEPGTLVSVWVEEKGLWVHTMVERVEKTSLAAMRELAPYSGYPSLDEWARAEEKRAGGSLPGWLILLRAVQEGG